MEGGDGVKCGCGGRISGEHTVYKQTMLTQVFMCNKSISVGLVTALQSVFKCLLLTIRELFSSFKITTDSKPESKWTEKERIKVLKEKKKDVSSQRKFANEG